MTPLTGKSILEKEIAEALFSGKTDEEAYRAAAEVAKRYIEEAFEAGYKRMGWEEGITWSTHKGGKELPSREEFLASLFPNKEETKQTEKNG